MAFTDTYVLKCRGFNYYSYYYYNYYYYHYDDDDAGMVKQVCYWQFPIREKRMHK